MLKYFFIVVAFFVFIMGMYSCHKDVSVEQPNPAAILKLLQNKWDFVSQTQYSATGIDSLRYIGTDSDYYNFTVNDSLYIFVQQQAASGVYVLLNDTTLLIGDGITYDTTYITKLTSGLLVLRDTTSSGGILVDTLKR